MIQKSFWANRNLKFHLYSINVDGIRGFEVGVGWIFSMALGDSDVTAMILFGLQTSSAFALLAYQFIVSTFFFSPVV